MTLARTSRALLLASGALLIVIATAILATPAEFYAMNQITLGTDASLRNELKAPAVLLLVAGVFMVAAVFLRGMIDAALGMAALIYLCWATSRSLSMVVDGLPAEGLVQAAVLEGVFGLACLVVLAARRAAPREVA